ncbi:N-acetylmuramoyl-L-alanine amidase [Desulfohalotomaculum tongense]|uniref:N-acetylmuramoyl-L-alanine amidase CwlD n=1 Tax=Desulforadius tongensis TaxID=1216062 RepID=UPI00195EC401|nr:N-acetylmuramoyl-L-alanine amidase CwlD [Desulforadius tongensis]MBM7853862.1 N-acetylmuramoyl-L-alanine amidase [Desulforadius tongensis]
MSIHFKVIRLRKRYLIYGILIAVLAVKLYGMTQVRVEQKSISTMSWSVANKVIVIDPGHGGMDPGKIAGNGVEEKEINLEISKRLATILSQAGAAVLLTRESDVHLSSPDTKGWPAKHREDLSKRVKLANDRGADLFISIHCNSFSDPKQHGAQVFYQPGSEESKMLAECIQDEIIRLLDNTKRRAKGVDYYVTRNTNMPTVIVETGFITNPKEQKLLLDPAYQSKMAWSIYAGIVKYYADKAEKYESN